MYKEISVDDLREVLHGELVVTYVIETCNMCKGLGYGYVEEGKSPSRRCVRCDGDGRVLKKRSKLELEYAEDESQVPLTLAGDYQTFRYAQTQTLRYKLDRRDYNLEMKYPELKALSYDRYDEVLKKYQVIEELKGNKK